MLRWGLIAPGRIAAKFADALAALPDHRLTRVAGRDAGRVQDFAARFGAQASPSIEALCGDEAVDIVYVASPHSAHAEHARAALRQGKAVLCEKSLTPDAASAAALFAEAQQHGAFLMEAVWTRFLPAWQRVRALLRERSIGELQRIESSFCFAPAYDPAHRLFDPRLAGGVLLDLGVYNLSLSQWAMAAAGQGAVVRHTVDGVLAPTGVEQRVNATLHFEGGARASFVCALDGCSDNALVLEGSRGWIRLAAHFSRPEGLRWCDADGVVHEESFPFLRNGMEFQAIACAEALRQGWTEHPDMPARDTLATLALIDAMRAQLGAR